MKRSRTNLTETKVIPMEFFLKPKSTKRNNSPKKSIGTLKAHLKEYEQNIEQYQLQIQVGNKDINMNKELYQFICEEKLNFQYKDLINYMKNENTQTIKQIELWQRKIQYLQEEIELITKTIKFRH